MTLPTIRPPSSLPLFRNQGHSIEEQDVFSVVQTGRGHARKRRIWTTAPRTVTVSWFLNQEQMTALDNWFERTLLAGSLPFAARVKKQGEGTEWWTAIWVEPYTANPRGRGWWDVSGRLMLIGDQSTTGPSTRPFELELVARLVASATVQEDHPLAIELSASLDIGAASVTANVSRTPTAASLAITGYAPSIYSAYIPPVTIQVACSNETTPVAVGQVLSFPVVQAFTLTSLYATLVTAQVSGTAFTVDVKKNGSSILSTKLTFDNGERTTKTAATPCVITDTSFAVDDEITIHVLFNGDSTATGLKLHFVGAPQLA